MAVDESERMRVEPQADQSWWSVLRPLVLRVHFYGGILVAPFLLVVSCTGLLYIFSPQMEQAVYAHALHVPASPVSQSLNAQVDAARAARPGDQVKSVRPATIPTNTTQVIFQAPDLPDSYVRTAFVDPHSGTVRDLLVTYGGSQALPLRAWIDQLHRNLNLGDPGRMYSELSASWLWVMVLGGLTLWIGRSRRSLRALLAPRARPKGRLRILSWHGAVGLWAAVALLFLSATGLTWSTYAGANVNTVRSALTSDDPAVSTTVPGPAAGGDVGFDRAWDSAVRSGVTGRVEITPPSGPGKAYSIQQLEKHWPTQQDSAAVDPATGRVTDVLRFADYPLLAKLSRWGIDAHMGVLFGLANQLVLASLALGLMCVIFWGYRMWWLRGPKGAFGSLPSRGAWRRVPSRVLAPLIVVVLFLGYFVPLFGLSLLVFVALDLWFGRRARMSAGRS